MHRGAIESLKLAVQRALAQDMELPRTVSQVEKELSGRFLTYSGEEVPKMEVLSVSQVLPALPPPGHGGCIPAIDWVGGRTFVFLKNPWECVLDDSEVPKDSEPKFTWLRRTGWLWPSYLSPVGFALGPDRIRFSSLEIKWRLMAYLV